MAKTLNQNPSLRFRDILAYFALALCAGTGLLVVLLGERINVLF